MTGRDRQRVLWIIDFIDGAMGTSGEYAFCRRGKAATATLKRILAVESTRRSHRRESEEITYRRRKREATEDILAGRDPMDRRRRTAA